LRLGDVLRLFLRLNGGLANGLRRLGDIWRMGDCRHWTSKGYRRRYWRVGMESARWLLGVILHRFHEVITCGQGLLQNNHRCVKGGHVH
jgi:hypothetical protein